MEEWIYKDGNKIHHTAVIMDNVTMGTGNTVFPYTVIGLPGFIREDDCANKMVVIGNNNKIGTNVSIMAGNVRDTVIGDNNLVMNYVNIGHDVIVGSDNEIGARTTLAGFSEIGDFNKIKLTCTIRNRAIIGSHNLIGMGSIVVKSFPDDNLVIFGHPAKTVKKR